MVRPSTAFAGSDKNEGSNFQLPKLTFSKLKELQAENQGMPDHPPEIPARPGLPPEKRGLMSSSMYWTQKQLSVSERSAKNKFLSMKPAQIGLLAMAIVLTGCETTDVAGSGSSASVMIAGHTDEEIRQTTVQVFGWNKYNRLDNLSFEKEGSSWDTTTYGSMNAKLVWIKMRARVTTQSGGFIVLSCDVYVVENHGDGFMQTERKLPFGKRDECKKILDQIKLRLSLPQPQAP